MHTHNLTYADKSADITYIRNIYYTHNVHPHTYITRPHNIYYTTYITYRHIIHTYIKQHYIHTHDTHTHSSHNIHTDIS